MYANQSMLNMMTGLSNVSGSRFGSGRSQTQNKPASGEDRSLCSQDFDKIGEHIKSGAFGKVLDIGNGMVAKIESCNNPQEERYRERGEPKRSFVEQIKQIQRMTKVVADAGFAPKIIKFASCGHNCITIMEKIEGGIQLQEAIAKRPETGPMLMTTLCKMIGWCHEQWAQAGCKNREGKALGHGDLHLGNVLIDSKDMKLKIIDFSFAWGREQKYDWIFPFESLKDIKNIATYKRDYIDIIKKYVPVEYQVTVLARFGGDRTPSEMELYGQ